MAAIELSESEDELVVTTTPARLVLRREHGRWTHALEIRRGGGWAPCSAAVESEEGLDELAVASPTYQEVQIAPPTREDQRALMLVGAFGPHHFAATVTIAANMLGFLDHVQFVFDVVDRCRSAAGSPAATYAMSLPPPRTADEEGYIWGIPGDGETAVLLQAVSLPMSACRLASGPGGSPLIARVEAVREPGQFSRRFVYSWAFSSRRA